MSSDCAELRQALLCFINGQSAFLASAQTVFDHLQASGSCVSAWNPAMEQIIDSMNSYRRISESRTDAIVDIAPYKAFS